MRAQDKLERAQYLESHVTNIVGNIPFFIERKQATTSRVKKCKVGTAKIKEEQPMKIQVAEVKEMGTPVRKGQK